MEEASPILNNPYEEPRWHYATNLEGELDYTRPTEGRRTVDSGRRAEPARVGAALRTVIGTKAASTADGSMRPQGIASARD